MKKITFLLSIFAVLSCNGQDMCVYSKPYGDSLKQANADLAEMLAECEETTQDYIRLIDLLTAKNLQLKATNDSLNIEVSGCDNFVEVLAEENNQLITLVDSLSLKNNQLNLTIQSLQSIIERLSNPNDTAVFVQDTIDVKLTGDGITMTINKIGNQKNYQLVDGLDRISLNYNSGKWELWVAYDKKAWKFFQGQVK